LSLKIKLKRNRVFKIKMKTMMKGLMTGRESADRGRSLAMMKRREMMRTMRMRMTMALMEEL
jgi:hypothetical protein